MGTTPAARLARLKVRFPFWSIRKIDDRYRAVRMGRGGRLIWATSVDELEAELFKAQPQ
jgi:hypothetical protein